MNPSKIFGIGLSRTGTQTLAAALNALGIRTRWFPNDMLTFAELAGGNFELTTLREYDAITDTPVVPYYPQFDALYPGSKFILTVRDKEAWLASVAQHWSRHGFSGVESEDVPYWRSFGFFISCAVYGCRGFNEQRFAYVYDTHLDHAKRYFENRPKDLLIMDICGGDGWDVLCPFLERDIPPEPFPRIDAFGSSDS